APLLAKADRVLPVIGPAPPDAIVGDRRGLVERDAHALGDGVHHAPGSRRHAGGLLGQGVAEAAGGGGCGVRFGYWSSFFGNGTQKCRRRQGLFIPREPAEGGSELPVWPCCIGSRN